MSARLRLLIAADALGGVWQYSLELARALLPLGVEPVIAVLGPPPSASQRAEARGLRLVETGLALDWLSADPAEVARAGAGLAALARRERADIVQTGSAALLAEADFDVPVVAVQHSCVTSWWEAVRGTALLPEDFRWRTELVRRGLRRADVVAAPSASFAATTARLYDLGERVRTVHNGRTQRQRAPAAPDDCVFTAGRLWDEGKDLATLDAAASRLAVPVCAAGPVQAPHGASIAFEAVHALGLLDEEAMAARLARRPIFVSSALYEPFGLAVLEAAAAGCPLILSDIPAFRELWDGAALFVAPRDADGFAATIEALLGDDLRRDALGRRARSKARRFTAAAMAAGMAALYGSLGVTETATTRLPLAGAAA